MYLNVTKATVSRWISERNIEKKERSADRRQTYITYNDVLMLAELYDRKVVSNVCPINIVEELKEVRGKLKALASEVEDIKHDFRVYVSRSIYVG